MYAIIPQQIPQDRRAEVNEKILFAIDSGKDLIPAESIYNCYTGIGGLHNLKQSDFANYNEYAEAKKECEMGQFFTPHEVCRDIVDMLSPVSSEMILDMCCGMGNFFNHLPNHHNTYGFDIDGKAVAVARYLYPDAHIEKCDIRQYYPEQRFDAIIGNPPFNLKFDYRLSQEYYLDKAYDVLNPAGILMVIVPSSFMQSEFWEKTRITGINSRFSFIGQIKLNPNAFASTGVHNFNTKVMVFLRKSLHIEMQAYNAEEFISMAELKERIREARLMKHKIRFDLMRETNRIDKEELEVFEYKLAKYMYELKAHTKLNRHIDKAEALVTKFRNQKPPENATREQVNQWEKNKLTTTKVLGIIRRYITSQNIVPRKEVALVKTTIIRQGFAQGGKHQRSCTGTSRTAHARTVDRKEYASDSCGGKADTQETQAIRKPEPAVCRYATGPISARIPRPHHFQKQGRRGMRVYITSKIRPESCLAETLRAAELAARFRQDGGSLPPCQVPSQIP